MLGRSIKFLGRVSILAKGIDHYTKISLVQPRADFTHLNSRRMEARELDLRADQRAERLIAREAAHLQ